MHEDGHEDVKNKCAIDKIQQRIDIINAILTKYKHFLQGNTNLDSALISDIKRKIEKEERNLQMFKKNHSEYFI